MDHFFTVLLYIYENVPKFLLHFTEIFFIKIYKYSFDTLKNCTIDYKYLPKMDTKLMKSIKFI